MSTSINGVKDDGSLEFFNWVFQSWHKFGFLSFHTKNGANYFQLLARFNDRQPLVQSDFFWLEESSGLHLSYCSIFHTYHCVDSSI